MRKSSELFFVSSNVHKYDEAKRILDSFGIRLSFLKSTLREIQSDSIHEIATLKAKDAFAKFQRPILVEDDGLFIDSVGGFPGPYSSFVFKTIGNEGILNLLKESRDARFVSVITYCDNTVLQCFDGMIHGNISMSQKGRGWGYDPIFIPVNSEKTFAELDCKDEISHRYHALENFSSWYLSNQ